MKKRKAGRPAKVVTEKETPIAKAINQIIARKRREIRKLELQRENMARLAQ